MEVKAVSKNTGVSVAKVRLYVDMVRGERIERALNLLKFATSPAAKMVAKTVKSAAANAENNFQMNPGELFVAKIYADEAPALKRMRAQARGRGAPILKHSSHITVVVADQEA